MFMDIVNDVNNDPDILKRLILLNKYIGKEDYFKTVYEKLKQLKKDTYYESIVYNGKLVTRTGSGINKDREKAIIFSNDEPQDENEKILKGIKQLIDFVYSKEELISCSIASITMFHKTLLSEYCRREGGKFRTANLELIKKNSDLEDEDDEFQNAKAVSPNFIEMYLYKLVTEYEASSGSDVIKSLLFMADFMTILPFDKCNFAVCMCFIKTFMLNQGIELLSYFSLEKYIYDNQDKFIEVSNFKNKGYTEKKYNLTYIKPMLMFGINALIDGYVELEESVSKNENTKYNKKEDVIKIIMEFEGKFKMIDIIEKIDIIINKQTINRILKQLLEEGKLEKFGDRKSTQYQVIK